MRITKLLRISSFQIIIGSFLAVILTGTFLLMHIPLLVTFRPASYTSPDPDRGSGNDNACHCRHYTGRAQDQSVSAKHHEGCCIS